MARRSAAERRLLACPLIAALTLSWALGVRASLCPAPTAMSGDVAMQMPAEPAHGEPGTEPAHRGGHDHTSCSTPADSGPLCPFAVGGIGPCGTTAPAPAAAVLEVQVAPERSLGLDDRARPATTRASSVPHPPPRIAV